MKEQRISTFAAFVAASIALSACGATSDIVVTEDRNVTPAPVLEPVDPNARDSSATADRQAPVDAHRQLQIVSTPQTVAPGERVRVEVASAPNTKIRLETRRADGKTETKTTDQNGRAVFEWTVNSNYNADLIPVVVMTDNPDYEQKLFAATGIRVRQTDNNAAEQIDGRVVNMPDTARAGEQISFTVEAEPGTVAIVETPGIDAGQQLNQRTISENRRATWQFSLDERYNDKIPVVITLRQGDNERVIMEEIRIADRTATGTQPTGM
jgi:hypothetical protein